MKPLARQRFPLVVALLLAAGGAVFLACGVVVGIDLPAEACDAAACDEGAPVEESSSADAFVASMDGFISTSDASDAHDASDADVDAKAPLPLLPCDDGGLPGALDPTFGDGGRAYVDPISGFGSAVVIQPDGKVVLGGAGQGTPPERFRMARLTASGGLDIAFGDGGVINTLLQGTGGDLTALAVTGDGRILAGGHRRLDAGNSDDVAVARYRGDGALDGTFGDGGVFAGFGAAGYAHLNSLAVLPDGHVLAAGHLGDALSAGALIAKLNPDGSLDTTFGAGGKVRVDLRSYNTARAMILQPDEKILAVGNCFSMVPTPPSPGLSGLFAVRLNADGSLDPSFGSGGKVVLALGPTTESGATAVALDAAGRIVLGGWTKAFTGKTDFAVFRLTPTGALDSTFGSGGVVSVDFGDSDYIIHGGIYIQPDGKYLAVGRSSQPSGGLDTLVRLLPNGSADLGFGTGGRVVVPNPTGFYVLSGAAAFVGGRATLAGDWTPVVGGVPAGAVRMGASRYCL